MTAATLAENLEAAVIGYADATIAWHALGAASYAQLRDGESLADIEAHEAVKTTDDTPDQGYDEATRAEMFVLRVRANKKKSECARLQSGDFSGASRRGLRDEFRRRLAPSFDGVAR